MHVTYSPKNTQQDGDPREWDIDLGDIDSVSAELIESHFGGTWLQFEDAVRKGGTLAKRLLLWHLMRKDHPGQHTNLKDVPNFTHKELQIEASSDELRELRSAVLKSAQFKTVAEREGAIEQVDREIAEALAREGKTVPAETTIDGSVVSPNPLEPAAIASSPSTPTEDPSPGTSSTSPSPTFGGATGSPSPDTELMTVSSGG